MVHFVALGEAAQNRDGIFDRWRLDEHLLEATFERRILLDVLAELVEGGSTHHSELATGEHGLEHVARVHRTIATGASADDGVELIDEGDDLSIGVFDLLEDGLQPLLKFAAILRASNHRRQVERHDRLILERLGDITFDDPIRESLDDGGLTNARFADQNWVVLRSTAEHLDHAADLVITADYGIELLCSGRCGEVTGVLLEALILVFGVLRGHAMRAADLAQRLNNLFAIELEMICHRQEQVFGRQVVVAKISACLVSTLEGLDQLTGLLDVAAECLWKGLQLFVEPVSNNHRLLTHPLQDGQHHTVGLTDERQQ